MFRTVVNTRGQFSFWPASREMPTGWSGFGPAGPQAQCLDEIERAWPDPAAFPTADRDGTADGGTLLDLFAHSAAEHAVRGAVRDHRSALTYQELDDRSSALAARLLAAGVGVEDRVACCMARGVDLVVAILGILKSGAAFLAVDPRRVGQQLDSLIQRSEAKLVLAGEREAERLRGAGHPVLEWTGGLTEPAAATWSESAPVRPENAACLIFAPAADHFEAVLIEHRNLVHLASNPALPALLPTDRTGQVTDPGRAAFHLELWRTLAAGAELVVLPSPADLLDSGFRRELRRHAITVLTLPGPALGLAVAEDRDALAPLRVLHAGGDVLGPAVRDDICASSFGGEFRNLYCFAETTAACASHSMTGDQGISGSLPLGGPVQEARLYVLDPELRPVPAGGTGELYVAGAGVGRGYQGAARSTAQRFRPDPFAADGARIFATGDLVRARADGGLDLLGPVGRLTEVQGLQVAPGDVERVLCGWDRVRDAAVLVVGSGDGARLAVLAVPKDTLSAQEVRDFLATEAADVPVPESVVVLTEIPVNEDGERDRPGLETAVAQSRRQEAEWLPPDTVTETYLADLWEELLGARNVGAHDDFFALGGQSLVAFRVQLRIGKDLGVRVGLGDIVESSRLRDLARTVDRLRAGGIA
ncbi:AMP-binding protein [Kitasatospora cineracea]|uniref:AMP-binding protein n=1 Tax=Kitasatospora cineracea TaxID=88074 RepID=UPI0033DDBC4F